MFNHQLLLMSGEAAAESGSVMDSILSFAPIVVVLIVFYFLLIRPQQKKDKEDRAMRENLEIGDEIVTIGGIIGKITNIKEDQLTIETGADRNKVRIMRWAVSAPIAKEETKAVKEAEKDAASDASEE